MNGKVKAGSTMLLIDGDNVSADVIEQALTLVQAEHGAPHVRRAYCSAEAALKQAALFKKHSIRPIVNLASGKNSTDIALACDAMDLVVAERPAVVVIVSSDSDFAPLVVRLREKGCRVEGIGQAGKTGDETAQPYDAFVEVAHRKPRAAPAKTARSAAAAAPREPAPAAPKPRRAAKKAAPPPPAPVLPDEVQRALEVLPALRQGVELKLAAEPLRAHGLLAKSAPSTRLFKKYPTLFRLLPEDQPNRVQFVGG